MHYGSVRSILEKKGSNLPWHIRLQIAKDAAKGMYVFLYYFNQVPIHIYCFLIIRIYLHGKKLIHRDLKTHNLLLNSSWECKVADFGISTVNPTVTRAMTCIGTPVYMAPEVLSKNKYSEKADVFSFGVVLYEIFTGKLPYSDPPFDKMNQAQLMYQIVELEARPPLDGLIISLQQLIRDCWNMDPRMRPSFAEIIVRLRRMKVELEEFHKSNSSKSKNEQEEEEEEHDDEDEFKYTDPSTRSRTTSSEYSFSKEVSATHTIKNEEMDQFLRVSENDPLIN